MDVGSELRRAREHRGLSIDDLSNRTKISPSSLRAIEQNDAGRLPAAIFTRGFLKAYAREVRLDPEDIAHRFVAQFVPPEDETVAGTEQGYVDDSRQPAPEARPEHVRELTAIAVVGSIVLGIVVFSGWGRSPSSGASESPGATGIARAGGSPSESGGASRRPEIATTGSSGAVASGVGTSDTGLHIELQPRDVCWISAMADGRRVAFRLMQGGERETIDARDELVLRVGDAGSCAFSINGSPARALGAAGQPATVQITPRNYQEFLAR